VENSGNTSSQFHEEISKLFADALQAAHEWTQNLGNDYRTVGLLIILEHSDPRAANCQARPVQGVHELGFRSTGAAETNVGAPRLKVCTVRY